MISLRITNNMLSNNMLRNLEAAQGRMDKVQSQMSSGQRISRPSDDPVGVESALRLKSSIANVEQWKANSSEGLSYIDTTDSVLADMSNILVRAKELSVQGANGTLSTSDRQKIALEVDQIREQLVQMANTKVGSKFIFGGTANKEPFPIAATQWQGSNDIMKYEMGTGFSLEISVNGKALFGVTPDSVTPATDNVEMFKTIENLSTALKESNMENIQTSMTALDAIAETVVNSRAELGARQNRMTSHYERLDTTLYNLTSNLTGILDADMAKTIIDFKNQENVYSAALATGAKIIQPSLVDFMK